MGNTLIPMATWMAGRRISFFGLISVNFSGKLMWSGASAPPRWWDSEMANHALWQFNEPCQVQKIWWFESCPGCFVPERLGAVCNFFWKNYNICLKCLLWETCAMSAEGKCSKMISAFCKICNKRPWQRLRRSVIITIVKIVYSIHRIHTFEAIFFRQF